MVPHCRDEVLTLAPLCLQRVAASEPCGRDTMGLLQTYAIAGWNALWSLPYYSGLLRHLHDRTPSPSALILMYHGVTDAAGPGDAGAYYPHFHTAAGLFRQHVELVARTCNPISLASLVGHLQSGEPPPPNSVCITLDDAYANVLRCAVPVLEALEVPATLFVCSAVLQGARNTWYDQAYASLALSQEPAVTCTVAGNEVVLATDGPAARRASWSKACEEWQGLPLADLNGALHQLLGGQEPPGVGEAELAGLEALSRLDPGLFEIGSHTRSHRSLTRLDPADQRAELAQSRSELSEALGRPVRFLAYPFGHYSDAVVAMAADCGYEACLTTKYGFVDERSDPHRLNRPAGTWRLPAFAARVWGVEGRLRGLNRR